MPILNKMRRTISRAIEHTRAATMIVIITRFRNGSILNSISRFVFVFQMISLAVIIALTTIVNDVNGRSADLTPPERFTIQSNSIQRSFTEKGHTTIIDPSRSLKRVFLSNRTVTCNDGSQAGFYLRKSLKSKRWVVFFEGGWYCYDTKSCRSRWMRLRPLMTSAQWPETRDGEFRHFASFASPTGNRSELCAFFSSGRNIVTDAGRQSVLARREPRACAVLQQRFVERHQNPSGSTRWLVVHGIVDRPASDRRFDPTRLGPFARGRTVAGWLVGRRLGRHAEFGQSQAILAGRARHQDHRARRQRFGVVFGSRALRPECSVNG